MIVIREFSAEEITYVVSNWQIKSIHELAKDLHCSWLKIVEEAKKQALEIPQSNHWSYQEVEILKSLADKMPAEDMTKYLNRSSEAIKEKANHLGIVLKYNKRRLWSLEEDRLLRTLWGQISVERLAEKMNRSVEAVKIRARTLKLHSMVSRSNVILISDVCQMMGVSREVVIRTWQKKGLPIHKKKISNSKWYYYVEMEELILFLKENSTLWDSRKVEPYVLLPEDDWLLEKRKKDRNEKPLSFRKWSMEELDRLESLYLRGKSCSDISEELQRSENAIKQMLRKLGYSVVRENAWSEAEEEFLRNNYQTMSYKAIGEELNRTAKSIENKTHSLGYQKKKNNY